MTITDPKFQEILEKQIKILEAKISTATEDKAELLELLAALKSKQSNESVNENHSQLLNG
jgi:predicted Zn-dependent peptidase